MATWRDVFRPTQQRRSGVHVTAAKAGRHCARACRRRAVSSLCSAKQWPVTSALSGLARLNYSIRDRKLLEGLLGIEYNAGCWQVRAVAHRFITATQQYSTSFQIQLELSGLSRIGINPLETLRQNISGYRRSDEIAP